MQSFLRGRNEVSPLLWETSYLGRSLRESVLKTWRASSCHCCCCSASRPASRLRRCCGLLRRRLSRAALRTPSRCALPSFPNTAALWKALLSGRLQMHCRQAARAPSGRRSAPDSKCYSQRASWRLSLPSSIQAATTMPHAAHALGCTLLTARAAVSR